MLWVARREGAATRVRSRTNPFRWLRASEIRPPAVLIRAALAPTHATRPNHKRDLQDECGSCRLRYRIQSDVENQPVAKLPTVLFDGQSSVFKICGVRLLRR